MILDPGTPIDLSRLSQSFTIIFGLRDEPIPERGSILDDPDRMERVAHDYVHALQHEPESETGVRNAIVYLLNLPDDRFDAVAWKLEPPLPRYGDVDEYRRLLLFLWDRVWASPHIPGFDPDDYDVSVE